MSLSKEMEEILEHTMERAAGKRYCGNNKAMENLVQLGFMKSLGKVSWVPDEYYTITPLGEKQYNFLKKQRESHE